jgi:hypothetical protein
LIVDILWRVYSLPTKDWIVYEGMLLICSLNLLH